MAKVRVADGTLIAYRDLGPKSDITPVLLVHGLAAGGRQFEADAAYFAGKGRRVLVPDLRGHGASGVPAMRRAPKDFTPAIMAADLRAVLDHAGVAQVHWVGNSLGGMLGFESAASMPERLQTLTTFGTAHRLNLPGAAARAIPMVYRLFGKSLTAWATARSTTRNRAARPLVAELLRTFDPAAGWAIAENVRRYDGVEKARAYRGPMLLLVGGRDGAVNRALARTLPLVQPMPNFSRVELADGGHCANLDATDQWRAALEAFWGRNAS